MHVNVVRSAHDPNLLTYSPIQEERIKALLEDLDESRQAYLKVVTELSERVLLSEIVAEPDPIEEVLIENTKERQIVEKMHQESASTMRSVREAHDDFTATIRSRLRVAPEATSRALPRGNGTAGRE